MPPIRRKTSASPRREIEPAALSAPEESAEAASSPFPVVGVGASAGGLEAFTQMLGALPADTGMAFVLVQHLAPKHASLLTEILARATTMPVAEAQDEMRVEPNHVYVIPPDRDIVISRGLLQLRPREKARGLHRPIDLFLRSLAEDQRDRAIGVILSGTATDGTLGLEEIKAEGGITFAQDDTAQQSSMPRSAIAAGCVDFVLPPAGIARELGRIARHPHVARAAPPRPVALASEPDLGKVLELAAQGHRRRLHPLQDGHPPPPHHPPHGPPQSGGAAGLRALPAQEPRGGGGPLPGHPHPRDQLLPRPGDVRGAQGHGASPGCSRTAPAHEPVRVWALGCSTGEEAYSLAIAFAEFAEARGSRLPIQIFATDLNARGHREGPRGRLLEEHRARRLAGAAAALLRRGGRQLPHQQDDPRHVRLRPPQRADRPALLPAST